MKQHLHMLHDKAEQVQQLSRGRQQGLQEQTLQSQLRQQQQLPTQTDERLTQLYELKMQLLMQKQEPQQQQQQQMPQHQGQLGNKGQACLEKEIHPARQVKEEAEEENQHELQLLLLQPRLHPSQLLRPMQSAEPYMINAAVTQGELVTATALGIVDDASHVNTLAQQVSVISAGLNVPQMTDAIRQGSVVFQLSKGLSTQCAAS